LEFGEIRWGKGVKTENTRKRKREKVPIILRQSPSRVGRTGRVHPFLCEKGPRLRKGTVEKEMFILYRFKKVLKQEKKGAWWGKGERKVTIEEGAIEYTKRIGVP